MSARTAVVTGAASGIGAATARRLHASGHRLVLVDRDEQIHGLADALPGATAFVGDVADRSTWVAVGEQVSEVHALHLNAGRAGVGPLGEDTTLDEVRSVIDTNLVGVLAGLLALHPALCRAHGAVVVTSSLAGVVGSPADPIYAATKHALVGLVRSLAPAWAPDVRIHAVCPSIVATPLVPAAADLAGSGIPVLDADHVATAVVDLLHASTTGDVVVIEEGRPPLSLAEPTVSALQA